jgi:hypothetical protein
MATLLKKLTLRLGDDQFECQLSRAEVTDEPTTSSFTSFCGEESFSLSAYKLNLEGAQDWTDVDGICNIVHTAYASDPVSEIDFEVAIGEPAAAWRSGQCKPTSDVPFGGTAGDPLAFTQVLDIVGTPDEVALTP